MIPISFKPAKKTYYYTVLVCIFFAVFSFFDFGPKMRFVGEFVYFIFRPVTKMTEILVSEGSNPAGFLLFPLLAILESFLFCYLGTLIIRVVRSGK